MARKPGTKSVHMNQALKTILGEGAPAQRPDVTRVTNSSAVDMVEIPSKGQTPAQMENKLTNMRESIGKPGKNIVQMPDSVGRSSSQPRMMPRPSANAVFIPLIIIQAIIHEVVNEAIRRREPEIYRDNNCPEGRMCA